MRMFPGPGDDPGAHACLGGACPHDHGPDWAACRLCGSDVEGVTEDDAWIDRTDPLCDRCHCWLCGDDGVDVRLVNGDPECEACTASMAQEVPT